MHSFLNEDQSIQNNIRFIFKSSEKFFLEDIFGDQILQYVIFIKPTFWRLRIQFLIYKLKKYNLTVVNTYNQSLYVAPIHKTVTIVHDHQFKTVFHPFGLRKLFYSLMFTYFAADKYIAISKTTMYEQIKFYGNHDKCHYIYNPINLNSYEKIERITLKCKRYFLFVGSDKRYKNLEYLISEYEQSYEFDNSHELVCIGGSRLPSSAPIHYLNDISQENLNYLYKNCTAVVVPSFYEGYCYPYIEAKLFKKPVVAYDMPISREILDARDVYFTDGRKGELMRILNTLMQSEQRVSEGEGVQGLCLSVNYFRELSTILQD